MALESRGKLGSIGWSRWMGASLLLVLGGSGCALSEGENELGEEGVAIAAREVSSDLVGPFEITITPPSRNIDVDENAFFTVQVDPLEGFSGDVFLDVASDPPFNGFLFLSFGQVTPPGQDSLQVFGQCDTAVGTYTLTVTGTGDDETTASASAQLTVDPTVFPAPQANISISPDDLTIQFFDSSFPDFCTDIVAWQWDFGDGATSTEENPVHTYAVRGDYAVTLTVTDNQGLSDTVTETITVFPPPPVLEIDKVTRIRDRFEFRVDLVWSGAEGDLVELRRNNFIVDLPDNDGEHRDRFRTTATSFRWEICELGINFCSNEVLLDVGGPNSLDATVTSQIDGRRVEKRIPIEQE